MRSEVCRGESKEGLEGRNRVRPAIKTAWVTKHNSAVWPVPYACAQPYHPSSGSQGQLFRPC